MQLPACQQVVTRGQSVMRRGGDSPFVCCEDWGWWVELKGVPFSFGVCIYSGPEEAGPVEFACTNGAHGSRRWSWQKFRFVDATPWIEKLNTHLLEIFRADPEVEIVGIGDEFPWWKDNFPTGDESRGRKREFLPPSALPSPPWPLLLRQLRFDRLHDFVRRRFDVRIKSGDDLAVAADQEFFEVPGDRAREL